MIGIHIARTGFFNVDGLGNVVPKDNPTYTLKQQMQTSSDHRVIPDTSIASSLNYPTVKAYLEAEAALDYVLQHIDQSTIITYKRTSGGGFAA